MGWFDPSIGCKWYRRTNNEWVGEFHDGWGRSIDVWLAGGRGGFGIGIETKSLNVGTEVWLGSDQIEPKPAWWAGYDQPWYDPVVEKIPAPAFLASMPSSQQTDFAKALQAAEAEIADIRSSLADPSDYVDMPLLAILQAIFVAQRKLAAAREILEDHCPPDEIRGQVAKGYDELKAERERGGQAEIERSRREGSSLLPKARKIRPGSLFSGPYLGPPAAGPEP